MENNFRRSTFKRGLKITLFVSLLPLGAMLFFTIDYEAVEKILYLRSYYLLLAVLISVMLWIVGGLRLKILAKGLGKDLSLKKGVFIFIVGSFTSNITPFASGGGPVQILLLHRESFSWGKATTVVMTQFILRLLFFLITAPILFFLFREIITLRLIPERIFDIILSVAIIVSLAIIYFAWQPESLKLAVDKLVKVKWLVSLIGEGRIKKSTTKVYKELEEFNQGVIELSRNNKASLFWGSFFTVVYWGLFFSIAPVVLLGLGADPYFFQAFVVQVVFYLILPYLPTPGGSGAAELGFAALFSSFTPSGLVGIVVLIWRFLTFHLVLLAGSILLLKIIVYFTVFTTD